MSMRILLNLLPEEKKTELDRRFSSRFFISQTALLVFVTVLYAVILGGIYFFLHSENSTAETSLSELNLYNTEAKRLVQYQELFKQTNTQAEQVNRYFSRHLEWGKLLTLLDTVTPGGVVLTQLATHEYTVSLIGQAATRDLLLAFEAALKQSECTSDVKVPLSNLFSQTDVDFQIDFNIRRECLLSSEHR